MPTKDSTEIIFVLDQSGSMEAIRMATIQGFNTFVNSQSADPGEAYLSLVFFDTHYRFVYAGLPLHEIVPLDESTYRPAGGTALLDALGTAIDTTGQRLSALSEDQRPGKVMVVVLTDGEENSSREYSAQSVRTRIDHQRSKYAWEFLFLGANQDAVLAASSLGIRESISFEATSAETEAVYNSISERVVALRRRG